MRPKNIEDKLSLFCDGQWDGLSDFPMGKPTSGNGFTYATDGRLIIRIPGELLNPNQKAADACEAVLAKGSQSGELVSITMKSLRGFLSKCPDCKTKGDRKIIPCPECDGEGVIGWSTAYNDYEDDCKSCDGEGTKDSKGGFYSRAECPTCEGLGLTRPGDKTLPIGNEIINPLFAVKIIKQFGPINFIKPKNSSTVDPIYFTFAGGDGIVMPMVI